jgi:CheY-like chemotaxis protein
MPQQFLVLLVDDDPLIQSVFVQVFAANPNYLLDITSTVEEAISKLEVLIFDLIFLDLKLEGNTYAGMDILRHLNRQIQRAANRLDERRQINSFVIIMSGAVPLQNIMAEAQQMGVIAFLDKPILFNAAFVEMILRRLGLVVLPARSRLDAGQTLPET